MEKYLIEKYIGEAIIVHTISLQNEYPDIEAYFVGILEDILDEDERPPSIFLVDAYLVYGNKPQYLSEVTIYLSDILEVNKKEN